MSRAGRGCRRLGAGDPRRAEVADGRTGPDARRDRSDPRPALPSPPADDPVGTLPYGAVLRLNRRTRVIDDGAALVGGSPSRVVRLKPAVRGLIRERRLEIRDDATRALGGYLVEAGLADPDPASLPPRGTIDVTVVIPAYGRAPQLDRLLASIRDDLGAVRVIVVDDGSDSPDAARIREAADAHGAELLALPENRGPADARNAGLERVTTGFVLFVDTDVVLRTGAVALLLRHFADPRLALVAPRIEALDAGARGWVTRYEAARSSLDHGPDAALVRPHTPMAWLSSTCLLGRTAALGSGFGRGMRVAEDVDLVWRLAGAGWRVRYEPAARVAHEHRTTVRPWLTRKFVYGSGAAGLARDHDGLAAPAVLAPWTAGALAALGAQRRWSIPVAVGISAVVAVRIARRIGPVRHPCVLSARLTAMGLFSAIAQAFALAVRHWWPAFAVGAVFSRRTRRVVVVAAVADAVVEYARLRPRLDPVRFAIARRLDDLAYGAGVWWSALRARSIAALLPVIRRRS